MRLLDSTEASPAPRPETAAVPARRSESGGPSARKLTLLLVATLTIMAGATISPALPGIETAFADTDQAALMTRLVLTLPGLLVALFAPLAGVASDRYGRRRLLIGWIVLYAAAGMSGLIVDSLTGLLAGRALLGMAVAGIMTTATALVGDYFAGAERDRFMGLQMAFTGFGGLAFLTAGGFLADLQWRAPFAIYGLALVLLPGVILFIDEPSRPSRMPTARDGRTPVGAGGIAIAMLFAVAFLNSVAFYLIPTQLPFYLRTLGIEAPSRAGLVIGMFTLMSALSSLAYGRFRTRFGVAAIFAIAFAVMAIGIGFVAAANSYATIGLAISAAGIGMGLVVPNLMAGAMALAPPARRGRIAGGLTASIFIGQFVSPFVSQPWIASFGFAAAFRDAGLLLAAIAAASAVAARSRRLRG